MRRHTPGLSLRSLLVFVAGSLVLFVALSDATPATATRGLTTGFDSNPDYLSSNPGVRDRWFDQTVRGGAGLVRLEVHWRAVVGDDPPSNPTDPEDPAYDFSALDAAVRAADERGLDVLLTVFLAPDWAEGPGRPSPDEVPAGAWKPSPGDYAEFGTALATRYSGSHPDPIGSDDLPRVRYYEAWNEGNLTIFLAPQWQDGRLVGPTLYRKLLNAFYGAVNDVDARNYVISAGTAPFGDPDGGPRVRPLAWLRDLFCLKGRRKLEPSPCPGVSMDALAHHPIGFTEPPRESAIHPDDVRPADLSNLKAVLRAAEKAGVLRPTGRRPLWVTEFWWITNPPRRRGISAKKQALYIEEALYLFWKAKVEVAINYGLRDSSFGSGVFFQDGTEKLSFQAFRFPFVTDRQSRKRVKAWGIAPAAGKLTIEERTGHGWSAIERLHAHQGGVFKTRLKLQGKAKLRARVGSERSLTWKQR